jgi:hypothetical protein
MENKPQSEPSQETSGKISAGTWIWAVCLTLALYVLSTGPMVATCAGKAGRDWIGYLYSPVFTLAREIPVCEDVLHWYVALWGYDLKCGTN